MSLSKLIALYLQIGDNSSYLRSQCSDLSDVEINEYEPHIFLSFDFSSIYIIYPISVHGPFMFLSNFQAHQLIVFRKEVLE